MKSELSSLDLYYLVKEFQLLVGAKVNKVFLEDSDFLFDFHKSGTGKVLFRVILPKLAFITKYKPSYPQPPGFCMFLRKRLINAYVVSVEQKSFERILEIVFDAKGVKYKLILELFSKGNAILCDETGKIVQPFKPQSWEARRIRGGMIYEYPPVQNDLRLLSYDDFKELVDK